MSDAINPDHYKRLPAEAIEIIEAMIAGAPDNKAAYLHGQGAKYDLRLWGKGKSLEDYLTDWQKHIWYALRLESHLLELIEKQKADEQQKAADLQSLKDHPFGKLKEPAIKQSLKTEPPDGWRFLEVGEVIRKGDVPFENGQVSLGLLRIGQTYQTHWKPVIRRNRFEVGEKVVRVLNGVVYKVVRILSMGYQLESEFCAEVILHGKDLAPYIEEAKPTTEVAVEVAGEVKKFLGCPDGWRFLEVGEVIRKGDRYFDGAEWKDRTWAISEKYSPGHSKTIRRNKFETGERVFLSKSDDPNFFRVAKHISDEVVLVYCDGTPFQFFADQLAPYIEDAK